MCIVREEVVWDGKVLFPKLLPDKEQNGASR